MNPCDFYGGRDEESMCYRPPRRNFQENFALPGGISAACYLVTLCGRKFLTAEGQPHASCFFAAHCRRYAVSLRERGAVGLVVNVETLQALNHLRTLVSDVPLSPVPADDLAERLGLQHYPALITATGIEQ